MALSWKARRYEKDGIKRRCSSACGADCTEARYSQVDKLATHIVVALGPEWRKSLNENMGWFALAKHPKGVDVHACVTELGVTYAAFYRSYHVTGYATPKSALGALLREVKRDVIQNSAVLTALDAL